jgi:hypothetical protein
MKFKCSISGQEIKDINDGYVVWNCVNGTDSGFTIIHQNTCDYNDKPCSLPLSFMAGKTGLSYCLLYLKIGKSNVEILEFHNFLMDIGHIKEWSRGFINDTQDEIENQND